MENIDIIDEESDGVFNTSSEVKIAASIDSLDTSECESLETSSSELTSPSWDSVLTFKYDADDEEVVMYHYGVSHERSESELQTSRWELTPDTHPYSISFEEDVITHGSQLEELSSCKNLQNSDTGSDSYHGDIEEGPVTDFEEWTQDDLTVSSIHVSESSDDSDLSILDPEEDPYLDEDFLFNGNKIWLHSKKLRLVKKKHRVRAFPITTDSSSDSDTTFPIITNSSSESDTTQSKTVAPIYRPAVKARRKNRGFLARSFDVFSCCFRF